MRRLPIIACGLPWAFAAVADAHDFRINDVVVVFRTNGAYQIDLTLDLDGMACKLLGAASSAEAAARMAAASPAEAEQFISRAANSVAMVVMVRFDGVPDYPQVTFPDYVSLAGSAAGGSSSVLGSGARLSGVVPPGARTFTFRLTHVLNAVQLTILDQSAAGGVRHLLGIGQESPPYHLGEPAVPAGRVEVAARYLVLGYEHILPKGLDHILFVLGLFLLSTKLRPLLLQVTAFTIAHSVTLGLSMYGILSLPPRIVEPLIAVSITYVAVENMLTGELKPWRPAVVFGFGLLHGLGFARVLHALGLPRGEFASALIAFNVGVELGQLSVVLLAFLAVGWFRRKSWYRASIVLPMSALIALTGFYWSVQRAFYGG